jgi:hypothetical protein
VGPTTAWMMVVNLVWVQPDRSPFHSAPTARCGRPLLISSSAQNYVTRDRGFDGFGIIVDTTEGGAEALFDDFVVTEPLPK